MGHNRLAILPNISRWRSVIRLVADGADVGAIADATMHAAETGLKLADGDERLKHTFYLLSQLALASPTMASASRRTRSATSTGRDTLKTRTLRVDSPAGANWSVNALATR